MTTKTHTHTHIKPLSQVNCMSTKNVLKCSQLLKNTHNYQFPEKMCAVSYYLNTQQLKQ